jgi:hypothetical protein
MLLVQQLGSFQVRFCFIDHKSQDSSALDVNIRTHWNGSL